MNRLLIIAASLGGGGAERVLLTLLNHLDREKFTIHLALVSASGPHISQIPSDVEVTDLSVSRVRKSFFPIIRLVRRLKPDVVFSTLGYLNLIVIGSKFFWPRNTQLWVREANLPSASISSSPHSVLMRWLYLRLYPRADGVICLTREVRRELVGQFGVSDCKLKVLVNPVDVVKIEGHRLRKNPTKEDGRMILAMGRLTQQKGFDLLMEAFAFVSRQRSDVRLAILGKGEEEARLKDLADSLEISDSLLMPGFVENPYSYFWQADLFVLSSRWEGLPNVVLEALACRTPVVGFDCVGGGMREIAESASGLTLVPSQDITALAQAILENLDSKKMGHSVLGIPSRYHATNVTKEYEKVLTSTVNM